MASSSAHPNHRQFPNIHGGATAAPPPTPSCTQPNTKEMDSTADALSRLFHRLPPNLSLPNRRSSSSTTAVSLPIVPFSAGDLEIRDAMHSAVTDFGYFQLTDDSGAIIPSGLANSAESDALSLFELSEEQKELWISKNWPLGYEADAETPSFCLDTDCATEFSELKLSSLSEFTRCMEKVGLKTVELLASALGFTNPFENEPNRFNTLMWLNQDVITDNKPEITNGFYPFVVCLQYQIREEKYCLLSESGWVSVSPRVDSVLVTLGDIAQVWRNGEIKRVKYRPVLSSGQTNGPKKCVTMTLMLTLPMDAMVSPLKDIGDGKEEDDGDDDGGGGGGGGRVYRSFCLEDYAWRVYHERLFFKDPLDRYKIQF